MKHSDELEFYYFLFSVATNKLVMIVEIFKSHKINILLLYMTLTLISL